MAKIEQGILGPYIGKLGPTVGYLWRGRAMVRAHVAHIRFPNTEAQLIERDWFVSMVRFAATARGVLAHGMRKKATQTVMSEANYFVMKNKRRFFQDGTVDYSALQFSEGPVAPVWGAWREVDANGVLTAGWQRHPGLQRCKGNDAVYLYVYHPVAKLGVVAEGRRRDGRLAVALPDGWTAAAVHCYLFAVDAQGYASPTLYVDQNQPVPTAEPSPEDTGLAARPTVHSLPDAPSAVLDGALDLHARAALVDDGLG